MSTELSDELLDPITADQPAGENLRWLAEWDRIKDARQSDDDGLNAGNWVKKDAKSADWRLVQQLSAALLRTRSKDLQLAMWFTEANVKLRGFAGLREGLAVARELLSRYWDAGLYPVLEDGPEDRSGPLVWFNDKVVDSILSVPITCSTSADRNYGILDLRDARIVGSEAQCKDDDGDISPQKRRQYDKAVAEGRVSLDMFESAVKESRRAAYEDLSSEFEAAYAEFKELEKVIDEKFGDVAPNLSNLRAAFAEIREESAHILARKRKEEPGESLAPSANPSSELHAAAGGSLKPGFSLSRVVPLSGKPGTAGSWSNAESMVRSG
jgi:type VI secretion system protein ImpA